MVPLMSPRPRTPAWRSHRLVARGAGPLTSDISRCMQLSTPMKSYHLVHDTAVAIVARMSTRILLAAAGSGLASLALACRTGTNDRRPISDEVHELARRSEEANDALMRGDVDRYRALVPLAPDFMLMSPFGGAPSH